LSVNRLIFRNARASELRNTELVLAGSAADTSLAAFSRLPLKAFEIEKNYHAGAIFLSDRLNPSNARFSGLSATLFAFAINGRFRSGYSAMIKNPRFGFLCRY
jgi:hypothetical protein